MKPESKEEKACLHLPKQLKMDLDIEFNTGKWAVCECGFEFNNTLWYFQHLIKVGEQRGRTEALEEVKQKGSIRNGDCEDCGNLDCQKADHTPNNRILIIDYAKFEALKKRGEEK